MKNKVYGIDQIPSYQYKNSLEWSCHDDNCVIRIDFNPIKHTRKLSGETWEWLEDDNQESEPFNERKMTRNEILDIAEKLDLVFFSDVEENGKEEKIIDWFKRKE